MGRLRLQVPSRRVTSSLLVLGVALACSAAGDGGRRSDLMMPPSGASGSGQPAAAGDNQGASSSEAGAGPEVPASAGAPAMGEGGSAGVGAGSDPCAAPAVLACDDFEAATLGPPWVITLDPYSQTKGSVELSSERAHSGTQAVKVMGGSGYNERALVSAPSLFPVADNHFFARFAVYFDLDFPDNGHMSYALAADSDSPDGNEVRAGVHTKVLNWNFKGPQLGDPSLFSIDADGQWQTGVIPSTRAWHCVELELDGASHTVRYFLDGAEIEKLHLTEEDRVKLGSLSPTWSPQYKDFRFGWQAYGTIPATIYYDDVIISTDRVPCDAP